ncbi:CesT family type III secretion system chaperone [Shewanella sp. SR44-3]|uniref:CesT family type III secretion system chaperone n=1 Tax=unclassified Shewanella TaxID=196818 RepID=UPI0015F95499|nr:CesT family type III secretion system chaperone [Shewanella sp. SR44-3]MBB1268995.1 CesT family type III secretion system chaperone [Shewanella sp. SR44-3]
MDALEKINAILKYFGDNAGLTDLGLKDNKVSLSFDDALIINIKCQIEQQLLIFEAQISQNETLDDPILRSLLAFNHHWDEHKLFFGLNLESQCLCLYQHCCILTIDFNKFENLLAEIVSHAERWAELLNIEDDPISFNETDSPFNISGIRV